MTQTARRPAELGIILAKAAAPVGVAHSPMNGLAAVEATFEVAA
jgi:hypothetical protein